LLHRVGFFGVKGFYSEPYFTFALLLAGYLLTFSEMPLAAMFSGFAFGAACACRLNGAILFPVFLLCIAVHVRARGQSLLRFIREALLFSFSFTIWIGLIGWCELCPLRKSGKDWLSRGIPNCIGAAV
jgi:hypothetical protein